MIELHGRAWFQSYSDLVGQFYIISVTLIFVHRRGHRVIDGQSSYQKPIFVFFALIYFYVSIFKNNSSKIFNVIKIINYYYWKKNDYNEMWKKFFKTGIFQKYDDIVTVKKKERLLWRGGGRNSVKICILQNVSNKLNVINQ